MTVTHHRRGRAGQTAVAGIAARRIRDHSATTASTATATSAASAATTGSVDAGAPTPASREGTPHLATRQERDNQRE